MAAAVRLVMTPYTTLPTTARENQRGWPLMPRPMTARPSRRVEVGGTFTVCCSPGDVLCGRPLSLSRVGDTLDTSPSDPEALGAVGGVLRFAPPEAEACQDPVTRYVVGVGVRDHAESGHLERAHEAGQHVGHQPRSPGVRDEAVADLDDALLRRPEAADRADHEPVAPAHDVARGPRVGARGHHPDGVEVVLPRV